MATTPKRAPNPILEVLRREVRAHPEDPDALYRLAVILMDPASLRRPTKKHRDRARELLSRAVQLRRSFAEAHALLAYVMLELDDPEAALSSLRRAVDLCPSSEEYQDFLLESLDRAGRNRALQTQLVRTAGARGVDLSSLRAELRAAGLPTNASTVRLNAFPAGEMHFVSSLADAAEAVEREYSPDASSDAELAQAARRAVKIDARRVPTDLRPFIALAKKWGISDDADRGSLVDRASVDERAELRKGLPLRVRRRINDWIDSFPDASKMTAEASHFMYLLEAYDEM